MLLPSIVVAVAVAWVLAPLVVGLVNGFGRFADRAPGQREKPSRAPTTRPGRSLAAGSVAGTSQTLRMTMMENGARQGAALARGSPPTRATGGADGYSG